MNFGKAKKILIFLFAFLNLFLIFQLNSISNSKTVLSQDSINKTVQLVASRGLNIKEDVIPRKIEVLSFLELINPLHNKEQFCSELSSYEKFDSTEKFFHIDYNKENFENEKDLLKFFNKTGFSSYSLKFENKISNPITNDEIYFYQQTYNSHTIYGTHLNATLNKNSLLYTSGNVYKIESANTNNYTPISPLQILLSLSRSLEGKKATVSEIKQGYYIPLESTQYQNLTAIPCYVFKVNKVELIYDLEKGNFLGFIFENGSRNSDFETALQYI